MRKVVIVLVAIGILGITGTAQAESGSIQYKHHSIHYHFKFHPHSYLSENPRLVAMDYKRQKKNAIHRAKRLANTTWEKLLKKAQQLITATQAVIHSGPVNWFAIAACESGGNWGINTGNGYFGGLQFDHSSWIANGGPPFDPNLKGPFPFSMGTQIQVANTYYGKSGLAPWPVCGARG